MVAASLKGRWPRAVLSVGLCLPIAQVSAQEQAVVREQVTVREQAPTSAPVIRDVELGYGGLLVGRLLDANGRPLHQADVAVLSSGKTLAATQTDADGVFAVSNLRGGVHQITTADNAQVCRLWANGTAPPQAPKSIDLVSGSDVVRGQYGPPPGNRMWRKAKVWATNPFIVGGVVAAAVAIPVALHDNNGPHS